jgi:predicted Rossmann fold flavoprotein
MKVAVIGGGAAGFFSAIALKENYPEATVHILEKSSKLLAKVKVSGGGRCNVTNACDSISEFARAYPRGSKLLKRAFHEFSNHDCIQWFEDRGVPLVTQSDQCIFPRSQDSQSIIDCFLNECKRLGVEIKCNAGINKILRREDGLALSFSNEELVNYDKVIVATGGSPKRAGLLWLEELGHRIEDPIPSLFTFNMPQEEITKLMGIVVPETKVRIQGTKLRSDGPLLITHWGMSGPAILKLSAFGARILSELNYAFTIQVNWVNEQNQELVLNEIEHITLAHSNKILSNYRPFMLPDRLWQYLLGKSGLDPSKKWLELGAKGQHSLVRLLTGDEYSVQGKTTFKEEFVTCGGVSLASIHSKTMESKVCKNLYFAGEVLDIDGITGGFNFQAAWTTGFIAGKLGN